MIEGKEILEYPYEGTITRTIAGKGMQPDTEIVVYEGVMDEHMKPMRKVVLCRHQPT